METLHKHGMGSPLFQSKGPPFLQLLLLSCEHVPGHTSPSAMTSASSFLLQFFQDKLWSLETKTTLMGTPSSPSNLRSLLLIYQQLNTPESPILPSLQASVSSALSPTPASRLSQRISSLEHPALTLLPTLKASWFLPCALTQPCNTSESYHFAFTCFPSGPGAFWRQPRCLLQVDC